MIYLVSYDLSTTIPEPTQAEVILRALEEIGMVNKCLKSSWLLQTDATPNAVYDTVRRLVRVEDRFFICPIIKDQCVGVTTRDDAVWDWLRSHT